MDSYEILSPFFSLAGNPIPASRFFLHSQGRPGYESSQTEITEGTKTGFRKEDGRSPGGDDFFVDSLLDLSHEDEFNVVLGREEDEEEKDSSSPENQDRVAYPGSDGSSIAGIVDTTVPGDDLSLPVNEFAHLEWLSHFVEDSFSTGAGSLQYSSGGDDAMTTKILGFPIQVHFPVKPRTKRNRTARAWPPGDGFSDSSSISSANIADSIRDVPLKRRGRKPNPVGKGVEGARRCSHCLAQKTPQWRAGPLGSKTLCNACGVRYKSGRLLPEYRPAGSPTFMSHVHSNSHHDVLEMKRRKEAMTALMTSSMP